MTIKATSHELVVQQGATFYLPLAVWISDGDGGETLLDTTGYTGRLTIRASSYAGAVQLDLTTAGGGLVVGYSPSTWAGTTAYSIGNVVTPATWNGYAYECVTAGTSAGSAPLWPAAAGARVADGTVTWEAIDGEETIMNIYAFATASQTAALTDWGLGVWTLELTDTYGNVLRVAEGTARLSREASY